MTPVRLRIPQARSICGTRSMDLAGAALSRRNRRAADRRPGGAHCACAPGSEMSRTGRQQAIAGHDGGAGSAAAILSGLVWWRSSGEDDHRRLTDRSAGVGCPTGLPWWVEQGESLYDVAVGWRRCSGRGLPTASSELQRPQTTGIGRGSDADRSLAEAHPSVRENRSLSTLLGDLTQYARISRELQYPREHLEYAIM